MANDENDLIAMADEYGRAVENYETVHEQVKTLKSRLEKIEEKLEATPAHTTAGIGIEAKAKATPRKARYSNNEAIVKSVASDAAQMAGKTEQ